jgi:hypothetical protein
MKMSRIRQIGVLLIVACTLSSFTGCRTLFSNALYVIKGDKVDALYAGLKDKRVAVICNSSSPASGPNSPAGLVGRQTAKLLEQRVSNIELVPMEEVADWIDRNNWNELDYVEIGRGVNADIVVFLDIESYSLRDGPTLYKGRATVTTSVYDIVGDGKVAYQGNTYDFAFPQNGAKHSTETSEAAFQRVYTRALSYHLAKDFFSYDKQEDFAQDATLIR